MALSARPDQRILVVDDDLMMRELLATRLTIAGYETFLARDGREAINALREQRPAAMVLDINMPVLNGFGVLEHLDASGSIDSVAVMVLTARNQTADVKRALQLGARDFLTKPFDDNQLLTRVARLMRRSYAH
ncbi:MAG: response regulator [Phenylobacterium zucineum]|nr:MAG: response regulator [Phenylobacterium zucineum]